MKHEECVCMYVWLGKFREKNLCQHDKQSQFGKEFFLMTLEFRCKEPFLDMEMYIREIPTPLEKLPSAVYELLRITLLWRLAF